MEQHEQEIKLTNKRMRNKVAWDREKDKMDISGMKFGKEDQTVNTHIQLGIESGRLLKGY